MDIYERFKYLRKEKKLSQTEFGESVGVGIGVIKNIEQKKVEPKELLIKQICKVYHINYIWLSEGIGDIYDNSEEQILKELSEEYNLSEIDVKIIKSYLQLSPNERKSFCEYISKIFSL